jgi:F0F1-type ATP synthase membrane subunit c/vacuolar-type H+-ATPase subunit K
MDGVMGRLSRNAVWLILIVAIAASITGLMNGFALDDVEVIIRNPRLHTLAAPWGLLHMTYWRPEMGATLYRPMTMLVFAIQWVAGGGSPFPFHVTSIALYAALSASVYRFAKLLMPEGPALAAALVFAVHPVHVEAVANIVGQAELWVALILVLIVTRYIEIRRAGALHSYHLAWISVAYLVACGFKEHAIVLPLLLIPAELFVTHDERPLRVRARELLPLAAAVCVAGIVFLAARYVVLHGVMQDSKALIFREQGFTTRFFTMLSVVVEWIRLFFWPMNLSADYSYPRIRTHSGFELQMLPAVAVIAGVAWIAWTLRKRFAVLTFGILWVGISMLIPSNLVIVTGFVLAERTLMLASVGFALCVGVGAHQIVEALRRSERATPTLVYAALAILVMSFAARSFTRSPVWRDNATLIEQTVQDVPSSHRAHWMRATYLGEHNRMPEALDEMDLAVSLGEPDDVLLLASGGDMFAMSGRCPRALTLYRRALALGPNNVQLRANTSLCLLQIGKIAEAKTIALAGENPVDARLQRLASVSDSLQLVRSKQALR